MSNAFFPPLATDPPDWEHKAQLTLSCMTRSNALQKKVEENEWLTKRANWKSIDSVLLPDFPRMTEDDLKDLTLGSYQVQLASEYTNQQLKKTSPYQIQIHKEEAEENIIRVKIGSRMSTHNCHTAWIQYIPYAVGPKSIAGRVCNCKVGNRMVGMCAHLCSAIWYLSYARHRNFSPRSYELAREIMNAADIIGAGILEEEEPDED